MWALWGQELSDSYLYLQRLQGWAHSWSSMNVCWMHKMFISKFYHCVSMSVLALAAITKHHKLSSLLTAKACFSQFWSLEVQDCCASLVRFWLKAFSWVMDGGLLLSLNKAETELISPGHFFVRVVNPFTRGPSSWPNYLPKAPPPNRSHGTRTST